MGCFTSSQALPTLLIFSWLLAVADALAKTTRHVMLESMGSGCADLNMENNGTFWTTVLQIGTPAQEFSVVVDTGSNSIVIPSCVCNDAGYCGTESSCFRGTNKSSTFSFPGQYDATKIEAMMITFGSGPIQGIRAMDVVSVGGLTANMTDGVLLMTDQALNFKGKFEGILGLGLPQPPVDMKMGDHTVDDISGEKNIIEELTNGITSASQNANLVSRKLGVDEERTPQENPHDWFKHATKHKERSPMVHAPKSFLEQAGVDRFSLCLNPEGGGMLRMGDTSPTLDEPLKNVGVEHWSLALHGIGVGEHAHHTSPLLCSSANMSNSQDSPCGMIPDSGTTALLGPKDQVNHLLESVCDNWSRCQKNHTALLEAAEAAEAAATAEYGFSPWKFDTSGNTKVQVLNMLLEDCETWMDPDDGLDKDGLPDLSFFVRGSDGKQKTLKITPADYVVSLMAEDLQYIVGKIPGIGSIPLGVNHTGNFRKVCTASISDMEYNTKKNGPTWILGVPLFQRYRIDYNLKRKDISFASLGESGCGSCTTSPPALASQKRSIFRGNQRRHRSRGLRTLRGPLRMPSIDVTRPL